MFDAGRDFTRRSAASTSTIRSGATCLVAASSAAITPASDGCSSASEALRGFVGRRFTGQVSAEFIPIRGRSGHHPLIYVWTRYGDKTLSRWFRGGLASPAWTTGPPQKYGAGDGGIRLVFRRGTRFWCAWRAPWVARSRRREEVRALVMHELWSRSMCSMRTYRSARTCFVRCEKSPSTTCDISAFDASRRRVEALYDAPHESDQPVIANELAAAIRFCSMTAARVAKSSR